MTSQDISKRKLPDSPGVYFFLGRNRKLLYVGRATSLRSRVRSYFDGRIAETRGPWLAKMLPLVTHVDYTKTDSVLEAILLEADLIKKFQPPFNTDEKDDKSFNCVVITDEAYPAVAIARSRDLDIEACKLKTANIKLKTIFGPFPHGLRLQDAMKIIRRIFPYRDQKCRPLSGRPCFSRQVGLCPGACTGEITEDDYAKTIRNIRLFFEGKKVKLLKLLEKEMKMAAKSHEFEKANEVKRTIFALQHIQDVALIRRGTNGNGVKGFRIEAYDLSHFIGKEFVGAMTVVTDGHATPSEYRLFKLRSVTGAHETEGLREVLRRRLNHPEWTLPNLIVVDGNAVQRGAAEELLRSVRLDIPVVAVTKNDRHKPEALVGTEALVSKHKDAILLANAESHRFVLKFQRKRRGI